MFASDRDLLVLEPGLFTEVVWPGQKLFESSFGVVNTARDELSVAGGNFDGQDVGAGSVVVVSGVAVEVVERLSATALSVSILRAGSGGPVVPLSFSGSNLSVRIMTFRQQIASVHAALMERLGIAPGESEDSADEGDVVNGASFVLAESLGALALIYASASALVDAQSVTWAKAAMYRERFARERERLRADLDLDGDGVIDATRRVSVRTMERG